MPRKIKVRFPKPIRVEFRTRVYMRATTRTYLWLRDGRDYGQFLTMDSGSIEIVRVPKTGDTYTVHDKDTGGRYPLVPHNYDFAKAVRMYYNSTLTRSNRAQREMQQILGLEITESDPDNDTREKAPKRPRALKSAVVGYSLAELCTEINVTPKEARRILRASKVKKPGDTWVWPTKDAATAAIKAIQNGKKK